MFISDEGLPAKLCRCPGCGVPMGRGYDAPDAIGRQLGAGAGWYVLHGPPEYEGQECAWAHEDQPHYATQEAMAKAWNAQARAALLEDAEEGDRMQWSGFRTMQMALRDRLPEWAKDNGRRQRDGWRLMRRALDMLNEID